MVPSQNCGTHFLTELAFCLLEAVLSVAERQLVVSQAFFGGFGGFPAQNAEAFIICEAGVPVERQMVT